MTKPNLQHLSATTSGAAVLEALDADGAVIVDDMASADLRTSLRTEVEPHLQAVGLGTNSFAGRQTKRIGALIARSPSCRTLARVPMVLAACSGILERSASGYQLHFSQLVSIGPGETAQPLHRDRGLWGGHIPRSIETQVSTIWALSEFTAANGATQVVPGSHLWDDDRVPNDDEIVAAEMDAGSVLLYTGSVLHGGGTNTTTDERRDGVLLHYTLNWLRQEENQYLSCPPDIASTLEPELQALIGYSQGEVNLGFFSDPGLGGAELADPSAQFPQPVGTLESSAGGRR